MSNPLDGYSIAAGGEGVRLSGPQNYNSNVKKEEKLLSRKRVKFTDLNFGDIFFAHNRFWVKLCGVSAREIGINSVCKFRFSRNFTIDPEDEFVLKFEGSNIESLLQAHIGVLK